MTQWQFRRIRVHEFYKAAWTKPNKQEIAPNLVALVEKFNLVRFLGCFASAFIFTAAEIVGCWLFFFFFFFFL